MTGNHTGKPNIGTWAVPAGLAGRGVKSGHRHLGEKAGFLFSDADRQV
jgi:hypothetical protein